MINVLGKALDTTLDRSVLGGYTRLGYQVRHSVWSEPGLPSLAGKTIAITGATSGIGRAAAELAAQQDARLILLVRDTVRGERVAREVEAKTGNEEVAVLACDLADLASVRGCAQALLDGEPRLDALINNAGVLSRTRRLSADFFELTFATNLLGPFLLTESLVPALELAAGRVINVSSAGMYTQRLRVDDLQFDRCEFDAVTAYARTKRAQVILTEMWASTLAAHRISVHAMHPGWVDTPGVESSLPIFHRLLGPALRTPEQGADTIVWLAGAPAQTLESGRFWHDRRPRPNYLLPGTHESAGERERLWETLERLTAPFKTSRSDVSVAGRRTRTA
jgi:dehydrogenase/reductase SDR family member 12